MHKNEPKALSREYYDSYMQSENWMQKRVSFFHTELAKCCYVCSKPRETGFHVHHTTYENFGNERMSDLRLVCEPCHAKIHQLHKNSSLTLLEATEKTATLHAFRKNKELNLKVTVRGKGNKPKRRTKDDIEADRERAKARRIYRAVMKQRALKKSLKA